VRAEWTPTKFPTIWQKLNPIWWFGNIDDGIYGPEDYLQGKPQWWRALNWFFRNPLHNLTFYVIGRCDKPSYSVGKSPEDVFVEGFNWAFTSILNIPVLPFVSYQGKSFKWYAGWRTPGGAFGFKLRKV
jgi:hypothetical protein